eukprot:TRINITY_DN19549_c0_g1_i1.p1 TRINITY_DN19549_c0_g1~~TRINITY_DN19549_c0_g1_i1.p1  ORF type:complete len:297 (+),score=86.52 TRINITY_DN19549_c0_g1_i1:32-892(+)
MDAQGFNELLKELNQTEISLRDERYDAVCHLVTAAYGAEEFYTKANNQARRETVEEARQLDIITREAWNGHPAFKIVGNESDFKTKITNVAKFFCDFLKQPTPHAACHRFFVRFTDYFPKDIAVTEIQIESHFVQLRTDVDEKTSTNFVLRSRTQNDVSSYSLSVMSVDEQGKEIVTTTKILQKQDYELVKMQAKTDVYPVIRTRKSFTWNQQYFELDFWKGRSVSISSEDPEWLKVRDITQECAVLNVDTDDISKVKFPQFIEVLQDITKCYSLKHLASKSKLSQ